MDDFDEHFLTSTDETFCKTNYGKVLHGVDSDRIVAARIPAAYYEIDYKNPDKPDIVPLLAQMDRYLDNLQTFAKNGIGLYLWSNRQGTGKTSLATYVLIQALADKNMKIDKDGHPHYWKARFTLYKQEFTEQMNRSFDTYKRFLLEQDILLVDDVVESSDSFNQYAKRNIDILVRGRAGRLAPTIITSNYSPEEFKEIYGEGPASYLKTHYKHVEVKCSDFRRVQAQRLNDILEQDL